MTFPLSLSLAILDAVSGSFFESLNQRADRLNLPSLLLTHLGVGRAVSRIPKVGVGCRGRRGRSGEKVRRVVAGSREGDDGDGQSRKDGYEGRVRGEVGQQHGRERGERRGGVLRGSAGTHAPVRVGLTAV